MAVRLEKQDSVGHIVLDRPPANTYDKSFLDELDAAIEETRRDDAVKAILVRSANEKFFSAGADISVFAKGGLDEQNAFVVCANDAMGKFESTPKVVVAAINGHCLGGGLEIALACDLRFAAEGSYRIGLPEVTLGLLPGNGGTQRLPRLIGWSRALDLMITGRTVAAEEAHRIGIVDALHPAGDLGERTRAYARSVADAAPLAVASIKRAVREGGGLPTAGGLALEQELMAGLFESADAKEGLQAFVEKRSPAFVGR